MSNAILTILGGVLAALLGVWAANYYRKLQEKKESLETLKGLKMELSTFSPTAHSKRNQASNLSEHEENGTLQASDAHVVTLKLEIPPLMLVTLTNTKLNSNLVGNIQNIYQIINRTNALIDGVVIERSSGKPAYDHPLGAVSLNYYSILELLKSVKKQIDEEIKRLE